MVWPIEILLQVSVDEASCQIGELMDSWYGQGAYSFDKQPVV